MNLPNKLTILRIFLVPVAMIIYFIDSLKEIYLFGSNFLTLSNLLILVVIGLASLTDMLDGHIARKYNLITNLGKFLDPLADKMMTFCGFMICLDLAKTAGFKGFTWWMIVIIVVREFMVSGIRMMAATYNKVVAANYFGKAKTVSQFITILYLLVILGGNVCDMNQALVIIGYILSYLTVFLTVMSGIIYLIQNKGVISEK